jgi:hypothetical protein
MKRGRERERRRYRLTFLQFGAPEMHQLSGFLL